MTEGPITKATFAAEGRRSPSASRTPIACRLEEDALRHLSLLERDAARRSTGALVTEILLHARDLLAASHLLYEILARMDRIITDLRVRPRRDLPGRLRLVSRLAGARDTAQLTAAFWGCYDDLVTMLPSALDIHPAVERVKDFVQGNYRRKLTLAEISEEVSMSRNYLSHLFRRTCGMTLTEYIHRTRLKQAERLLVSGQDSVAEIAFSVGYQNYRDFHRNFVKYERISPKKFRKTGPRR